MRAGFSPLASYIFAKKQSGDCISMKALVEALDEPVLQSLAGRDEMLVDLVVPAPGEPGIAGKLGSIITHDLAVKRQTTWGMSTIVILRRDFETAL